VTSVDPTGQKQDNSKPIAPRATVTSLKPAGSRRVVMVTKQQQQLVGVRRQAKRCQAVSWVLSIDTPAPPQPAGATIIPLHIGFDAPAEILGAWHTARKLVSDRRRIPAGAGFWQRE